MWNPIKVKVMFRSILSVLALQATIAEARRVRHAIRDRIRDIIAPRPADVGVDEDGSGDIEQLAAFCEGSFGTGATDESFFVGIAGVEGTDQDDIFAWGKNLKAPIDAATGAFVTYGIVLTVDGGTPFDT